MTPMRHLSCLPCRTWLAPGSSSDVCINLCLVQSCPKIELIQPVQQQPLHQIKLKIEQKAVCFHILYWLIPETTKNLHFMCLLYPEFFFELVLHLYPGEETKGPTVQEVM